MPRLVGGLACLLFGVALFPHGARGSTGWEASARFSRRLVIPLCPSYPRDFVGTLTYWTCARPSSPGPRRLAITCWSTFHRAEAGPAAAAQPAAGSPNSKGGETGGRPGCTGKTGIEPAGLHPVGERPGQSAGRTRVTPAHRAASRLPPAAVSQAVALTRTRAVPCEGRRGGGGRPLPRRTPPTGPRL